MSPRRGKKKTAAPPPPLHELESEVMEEMWKRGEGSVREVMEALNHRAERPRAYTTYMTIMVRLDRKGVLERHREGKTDIYAPVHDRERYMALRAESEVQALVDQYGDVALSHFAREMSSSIRPVAAPFSDSRAAADEAA